jgi:ATP-dependent DNA helicase RecG
VSGLGFRHLSIGDLDEQTLRDLVAEGETLFVERKEADPSRGIGQTVAAFANTLGGWLLLGVADDGALTGHQAGAGDFADKIRHKLRVQVEPLPPFSATTVDLDGVKIGLVRIFESADTPHIVLGTGSIPVRSRPGREISNPTWS